MIFGSEALQRRQFGAMTIAKLLASILVTEDTSVWAKIYKEKKLKNLDEIPKHTPKWSSLNTQKIKFFQIPPISNFW